MSEKIISLQKKHILKREEKRIYFFLKNAPLNYFQSYKNGSFEIKNKLNKILKIKETKIFNDNEIKENQIKKIRYKIKDNNIIIHLIKFIIISIFLQIKSNILFEIFHSRNSKITLKIKGIGVSTVFGNETNYNFNSSNFPNKININGKNQDTIEYKYYFNQTENIVELIWDNNINNCSCMFRKCSNITEIDLSNFNTSLVTSMYSMFYNCSPLISLNLSYFDTSKVTNMNTTFCFCKSLTFLDLSNYNSSNVKTMGGMFFCCSSLTSLNLSNLDTSKVTSMHEMFYYCSSLTSLDLTNFNTSQVTNMGGMFSNCSSLTSLNLSNFDTSQVTNMGSMFYHCSSLTSLNLSNFDTSQVTNVYNMFFGCSNLEYINMINFNENKLYNSPTDYGNMFTNIPKNIVICINNRTNQSKIIPQINAIKCHVIDCTNDWKLKQKKIINNTNECIDNCNDSSLYNYEYNGKCYESCEKGYLNDNNNNQMNKCKCELDKCLSCPNVALHKGLCKKCNTNYYPKENDPSNLGEYINCYEKLKGYYLDNFLFKQCYYSCKACNISGNIKNHNCLECNENYTYEINYNNYINCYKNCSYYHYFDDEYNYHCTINSSCPNEYPKLNKDKMECIKNSINDIIGNLITNKKNETEKMSQKEEIEFYDNIIQTIEKGFTNNYNTLTLDNGQDEIITTDKITVTLTTSQNQKSNINKNITTIDLGECETLLRNEYNISINETLYMKKIDIAQEGVKTPKVEYDVYCKLFGNNLTKLNLTICKNSKISIYIPFVITDNVDKYNSSSGYYNDICYTTTSEDGTDISLKDRQQNFINDNKMVCQEDCIFIYYDSQSSRAQCSCNAKESSSSIIDMNIDKTKLLDNFINIKNIVNFNFLACYKNLFCILCLLNNIGSYIILFNILLHFITFIIFYINQFTILKKKITNIINIVFEKQNQKKIETVNNNTTKMKILNKKHNNLTKKKKKLKKNKQLNPIKKANKIMKLKDEELNSLPYNLAIIYDKRNYCEFYASLLKTQHNFINAFFNNNDYNSKIIKIDLFFIGFTIEYTVNGLFFNDDTMHKIYESKGELDLENQLPIIIYSTLISMILNSPLNYLGLSNDAILNFKQSNSKINIKNKAKKLKNILEIKFLLYFIISFLFLVFFWYYISMFGVIYKNTQIHLLKDTLMSFSLSLIIPFGIYIFPGLFRIPALFDRKRKRKYLYNIGKFLQSF